MFADAAATADLTIAVVGGQHGLSCVIMSHLGFISHNNNNNNNNNRELLFVLVSNIIGSIN